jgi:hypothetical protein
LLFVLADQPVSATPTPIPSLERVKLSRGFSLEYVTDTGTRIKSTFLGYVVDDPGEGCVAATPCAVWKDEEPSRVFNAGSVTVRSSGTYFFFYDEDWNLRREVEPAVASGSSTRMWRLSLKLMRFPLVLGDVWSSDGKDSDGVLIHRTIKVAGWEHVSVPAGEFDTVHIHAVDESRDSRVRWHSYAQDYYYEPALGIFVRIDKEVHEVDPWFPGPVRPVRQELVRMFQNGNALRQFDTKH